MKVLDCLSYKVYFGSNAYTALNEYIIKNESNPSTIFVLVDNNTREQCLPILLNNLALSKVEVIEIEHGEHHKNIKTCVRIWKELSALGADRNSLMINLGGGVITDMGGFVASTFKRGIRYINIPTTLLSQVDASVGGKTGIDLGNIKNQIGVFSHPRMVITDIKFLQTLSRREMRSGFSEMLKHGVIADKNHWKALNDWSKHLAYPDNKGLENLIFNSVSIKKRIVESDPKEQNLRKKLNFGHTIGHAIESHFLNTDSHLLHGEAIAAGMICEAYLSHKICGLSKQEMKQIKDSFLTIFPKISLSTSDISSILNYVGHDKKNINGKVYFSLISKIGNCEFNYHIEPKLIRESFSYYLQ